MVASLSLSLCNWHSKSMQWSLSWEASSCSAGQEIPRILWNPKVHKRLSTVPILSRMNPDHDPHPVSWTFILIQFRLRLVHASGLFPFGFPTKTPCVSFRFLRLAQGLSRCLLYISFCPIFSCQLYITLWTVGHEIARNSGN